MSTLTRTDVTAVNFYKHFVIAGIGSTINIFEKASDSRKLIQRLTVLNGQKIYGILPTHDDKILVFGGKQFTVVTVAPALCSMEKDVLRRLFTPVVCDDWLHSAVWVDDGVVALLTAHNIVQKWNTATQTLISQHPSKDNSILYSGLLLPIADDIIVMAGTVFSEVIIHKCSGGPSLHHLKGHKGVIFSISCKPENNIIVTTSDDRSVRIWGPNATPEHGHNTVEYWENINIVCKHEVYGHLARVMRSCITNNIIVSVGEDSAICYWDYQGKLLKKTLSHQNGCIWSVDSDGHSLITGGGDSGLILHPLTAATDYCHNEIINVGVTTPNKVAFTARNNLIVMDKDSLVYHDFASKNNTVFKLNHDSTYKFLALSSCKQLIAVADMAGKLDVYVEKCKNDSIILNIIDTKLHLGKILSMQWAGNRHLVFCSDGGNITVLASMNSKVEVYANFVLPSRKEICLTASAIDFSNNMLILGDRNGNIHMFVKGQADPVKTFYKVHGRYGPTSISINNNDITTTGRDGTIKYFRIEDNVVKLMTSKNLAFEWAEKFLDKHQNMICGFQERVFVVSYVVDNSKILEVPCGGGHRSWDAVRYFSKIGDNYEEFIKLIYLKKSDINVTTVQLNKIVSKQIINGSHAKEINCLEIHKIDDTVIYIAGGEDTTLRVSSVDAEMTFKDEVCFKHLSSVRTVKTYALGDNRLLVLSAGGRAQICVRDIRISKENNRVKVTTEDLIAYVIKGDDKDKKSWRNHSVNYDLVMRIMDVTLLKENDELIVFAGCSDAYLRVFSLKDNNTKLELIKETKYHNTCILKTESINIFNRNILITCTTRGDVTFWDVTDAVNTDLKPFFSMKTNKSGINSIVSTIIAENKVLISTGGDDNTIHIALLEIHDQNKLTSMKIRHTWNSSQYHSSQITGLCLVGDYLVSASIDQRITLLHWSLSDEIKCEYVSQTYTDVSDVQGMKVLEHDRDSLTVCIFGKGMEVIMIPKTT